MCVYSDMSVYSSKTAFQLSTCHKAELAVVFKTMSFCIRDEMLAGEHCSDSFFATLARLSSSLSLSLSFCLPSGVAPPKTGLQWQQPFLELVLACMHAQSTTHEELLGPLKTQLSTFLAAYDKVHTCYARSSPRRSHFHFDLFTVSLRKVAERV